MLLSIVVNLLSSIKWHQVRIAGSIAADSYYGDDPALLIPVVNHGGGIQPHDSSSVGVYDCLSACISAENPDAPDSPSTLPVVAARFFSGGVAVCCVLPVCR